MWDFQLTRRQLLTLAGITAVTMLLGGAHG